MVVSSSIGNGMMLNMCSWLSVRNVLGNMFVVFVLLGSMELVVSEWLLVGINCRLVSRNSVLSVVSWLGMCSCVISKLLNNLVVMLSMMYVIMVVYVLLC